MNETYFSYTLYTHFSTESPFTTTHVSIVLSICSLRAWREFRIGWWSIFAQMPPLRHQMKNVDTLTSPSIFRKNQKFDGAKSAPQRWCGTTVLSGLSWRPEFVYCSVAWRCCDANETFLFSARFWGCVAWVIKGWTIPVGINRRFFSQKFHVMHAPCIPKDSEHDFFLLMELFLLSLHSENLDDDIPCIAFCFPDHNDEPRIRLQR